GIGVPGVVDHKKGVIKVLPNLRVKDIEIAKILKQEFRLPVFLRNDAEIACLGEAYAGAGKKFERVFFITVSTGLGGAFCVNKEIQD
ncbi:ROK family protein, partial [Neisseria sp. P0015.S009]|uniref:ROK family protein n=1 Tax=Neisseria sp. P0015.S009 TaxID=3436765 RepID=UPI003F809785